MDEDLKKYLGANTQVVEPRKKIDNAEYFILKLFCLLVFSAKILNLFTIHLRWGKVVTTCTSALVIGFWVFFIVFLRKFTGTDKVAKSLKYMCFCLLAGFLLLRVGNMFSMWPKIGYSGSLIIMASVNIIFLVFYIKSGINMMNTTSDVLKLDLIGKTVIICVIIGFMSNFVSNILESAELDLLMDIARVAGNVILALPFAIMFFVVGSTQKILRERNENQRYD